MSKQSMTGGNDGDALAYLAPLVTLLGGSRATSPAASVPTDSAPPWSPPRARPRPMEPMHRSGMERRARDRLEQGRSESPRDVEQDIDWHADYYGYENPATEEEKRHLAAQFYSEHEQAQLMKQLMAQPNGGRRG